MALWTPALISTALWLDAADSGTITLDGSAVSEWRDKSGNARHAAQSSSSFRPSWASDEITFDGSDDFLVFGGSTATDYPLKFGTSSFSVFAVINPTSTGALRIFFGARGFGDGWFAGHDTSNPTFRLFSTTEQWVPAPMSGVSAVTGLQIFGATAPRGSTGRYWRNGDLLRSTTSVVGSGSLASARQVRIGSYTNDSDATQGPWVGKINEVILLPRGAEDEERQKIEGYLAHKWGLTGSLPSDHPYKTDAPQSYSVSGIVTGFDGDPVARIVRAYQRSTGALLAETTSDASTGYYEIALQADDEVQRVVLDNATADPLYNDLIDRVIPQ
jgi:hypothetical protein